MAGNGNLNVDSAALNNVGRNFGEVASQVRSLFTDMQQEVDRVTGNDSWQGEASRTFLEKFNSIKPRLETHLQQLEALGPAVNKTANNYEATEAENTGIMRG